MFGMPIHNWQFWLVTAAMLWGLWIIARPFLPLKRNRSHANGGACPNCSSGQSASRKPRQTSLTIEGRRA